MSQANADLYLVKQIGPGTDRIDVLYSEGTALPIKYVRIYTSTSGDHEIIAGVDGKRLIVIAGNFIAADTVVLCIRSLESATEMAGPYALFEGTGEVLNECKYGHFATEVGEGLNFNTDAAEVIGGCLTYVEV